MSTLPLHLISIAYRPSTLPPQFSFLYLLPIISFSSSILIFSFPQFHHILSSPCHLRKGHWDRRIDRDLSWSWCILLLFYFLIPLSSLFWEKFSSPSPPPRFPFHSCYRPEAFLLIDRFSHILLTTSLSVQHPCSPFYLVTYPPLRLPVTGEALKCGLRCGPSVEGWCVMLLTRS